MLHTHNGARVYCHSTYEVTDNVSDCLLLQKLDSGTRKTKSFWTSFKAISSEDKTCV